MSPRYKKPRNCNCQFKGSAFKPAGMPLSKLDKIAIYRDEVEALKLCDMDGLNQEEAGERMGVSRGTVQRILKSGRAKVAKALATCNALVLEETICNAKMEE